MSSLDGREVEFANASARRFCRELAGRDDAVGWATCLSLLADGDTVLLGTAVERLRGGDIFQDNVQLAGPNGVRHLRITAFPIRESDGRILRFGCVAEMPKPLGLRRVYLVSHNAQLGRRLSSLLTDQGFEVRIFHDIRPLVQVAPALLPGCVVLSGVEDADWLRFSASAIRQLGSRLPTVALSEHHRDVDHVRTLMKAGIKDVLPAIGSAEQLTSAVASFDRRSER